VSLYRTAAPLYQAAPPRLRGLVKTLIAIAPVSAMRAETLLGVRSHGMIDTLFVLALILPINAFVVHYFCSAAFTLIRPQRCPARWMRPCSSCRPDDQWRADCYDTVSSLSLAIRSWASLGCLIRYSNWPSSLCGSRAVIVYTPRGASRRREG
jgi:hypothetical protein